jgi:hypothetical protein
VSWSVGWRLHAPRIGEEELHQALRTACEALGVERFECRRDEVATASFTCLVWLREELLRRLEDHAGLELIHANGGVPDAGLAAEISVTHFPADQWDDEHSLLGVDSGHGANRGCWHTTTALAQRIAAWLGADAPT